MAKVHCVILDDNQMPRAKAILTDIRGTDAYLELVKGSYSPKDFETRQTIQLRILNTDNEAETYRGRIAVKDKEELELAHFEMLNFRDKRDDVKVVMDKPVWIICTDAKGGMRKTKAGLRDLSAGGIGIVSQEDIPEKGGEFELVYDLSRKPDVLKVRVIHKRPAEDGGFFYGCRFVDLHFTQEHMVREYVFKRHLGLVGRSWRS